MCAQSSLPVVPEDSAASGGVDSGRSGDPKSRKRPAGGLRPRKPGGVLGLLPSDSGRNLRFQPPKQPVRKVRSFRLARTHHFTMLHCEATILMI